MKLCELINEWLYINHKYDIKERTLLRYESIISHHLDDGLFDRDIDEITPRDLQLFINKIREEKSPRTNKQLSPSSINTLISMIKQCYGYAIDYEITNNNPTARIKRIKENKNNKIKSFTKEEQIKLEKHIDSSNNNEYIGIIIALYTGVRLGELLALTWKDVNLKTGVITINKTQYKYKDNNGKWIDKVSTPKSPSSNREIPIPTFLKELLKALKTNNNKKVIVDNNGLPIEEKTFIYRYHCLLKKSKVRDLNFHCLRHTFATRALENKMDIKTLSEILGHASASTTLNIYTHSLIEHKKHQMRKIKRLI